MLIAVFYANHVHNNAMVQWAQNLAGQAFASIATLVVKGAFGAQQTTVSTPSTQTVTKQLRVSYQRGVQYQTRLCL